MTIAHDESVLIVDFGSQVTQLIARRVREAGVYSEIAPFSSAEAAFARLKPKGIILSGGPASVTEDGSPRAPDVDPAIGPADPGHLLRPADDDAAAGRHGRRRRRKGRRIRPRVHRDHRSLPAVRRPVEGRRGASGVDEPWRQGHRACARFPRGGIVARRALCGDRRRRAPLLRDAVPPRGGSHPRWRQADRQFRQPCLRLPRRLVDGRVQGRQDCRNPRAGRLQRA